MDTSNIKEFLYKLPIGTDNAFEYMLKNEPIDLNYYFFNLLKWDLQNYEVEDIEYKDLEYLRDCINEISDTEYTIDEFLSVSYRDWQKILFIFNENCDYICMEDDNVDADLRNVIFEINVQIDMDKLNEVIEENKKEVER